MGIKSTQNYNAFPSCGLYFLLFFRETGMKWGPGKSTEQARDSKKDPNKTRASKGQSFCFGERDLD